VPEQKDIYSTEFLVYLFVSLFLSFFLSLVGWLVICEHISHRNFLSLLKICAQFETNFCLYFFKIFPLNMNSIREANQIMASSTYV